MAEAPQEARPTGPARKPGIFANILAIAGFVILIIIVIWGLSHIISLSTPWFSDIFSGSKKTEIVVTAPTQVVADTPFDLSWKYSSANRGTYAILYRCAAGLKISVDGNVIPCGAAYTLGNATSSASLTPSLTATSSVQTAISVLYIPSAAGTTGPEATGSASVRVVAAPAQNATPEAPKPVPDTTTQSPATPADLSVRIIATGVIDPYTGTFIARAPYSQNEVSAVQFDIQNIGGTASGSYTFEAQIPTSQPYTFRSEVQPSLAPGSHIINTLRFTPAVDGTFSVQIAHNDANQSNNFASEWVLSAYNQYPQYQY